MSRDTARLACRLFMGSAMSLGCLTALAQESAPAAAEEALAVASDQGTAAAPPEPSRLVESTTKNPEEPGVPRGPSRKAAQAPAEPQHLLESTPAPAAEGAATDHAEIITERYPNRTVKIERRVVQDADGNYLNHGLWTYWSQKGEVVGSGEFKQGRRHGKWVRWHEANEAPMFNWQAFKYFQGPFASEAQYENGKLQGAWVCFDAKDRKICSFDFVDGDLNGKATWFFPTGHKRREVDYANGAIDGAVMEWTLEERSVAAANPKLPRQKEVVHRVVSTVNFERGRIQTPHVEYHSPGVKKMEGAYLNPSGIVRVTYDWWNGEFKLDTESKTSKTDKGQKHGVWTGWHKDGGKQWQGEYHIGSPVGTHVWWHANGQKLLEGSYEQGKEAGKWTWWYASGQKLVQGDYTDGIQIGAWSRWDEAGQVVRVEQFTPGGELDKPRVANEDASKNVERLPSVPLEANGNSASSRRPRAPVKR